MKNLLKNIWIVLVVTAIFFSTVSTVEAIIRRGAGFDREDDIILPEGWFKPYEAELKNPNLCWIAAKPNKKADWLETYELKTQNVFTSISYGKAGKRLPKVAFNASFSKNQPPLAFWLYFEGSAWTYGNSSSRRALIHKGLFSKKELSQNIKNALKKIHPDYLTPEEIALWQFLKEKIFQLKHRLIQIIGRHPCRPIFLFIYTKLIFMRLSLVRFNIYVIYVTRLRNFKNNTSALLQNHIFLHQQI